MASIPPISAICPSCQAPIELQVHTRLTSDRAPGGAHALVFMELDASQLRRHIATHEADEQEAAA